MRINLGKQPFKKFTKSALVEMIEDAVMNERERSLPAHKRGKKERREKTPEEEDADEERDDLADLDSEMHGEPEPVDMDDEDMSDDSMEKIESKIGRVGKEKKPKAKSKKD